MTSPFDSIQRGFDNTVANWPLVILFFVESLVLVFLAVVGVVAAAASAGLAGALAHPDRWTDDPEVVAEWIVQHPGILVAGVIGLTLVLALGVAVHSFVVGAATGIYSDGERAASTTPGDRAARRLFAMGRWASWGARTWWPVFLIYNVTWGIYGLILLVPLTIALLAFFAAVEHEAFAVAGCFSLGFLAFVAVAGGLITFVWSRLAITVAVARRWGVVASLREGVQLPMRRFGDVAIAMIVLFVVSMGVSLVFFSLNTGVNLAASIPIFGILMMPAQLSLMMVNGLVSIFVSSWLTAAFVSIVVQDRPDVAVPVR